jgi:hypothetical protein
MAEPRFSVLPFLLPSAPKMMATTEQTNDPPHQPVAAMPEAGASCPAL